MELSTRVKAVMALSGMLVTCATCAERHVAAQTVSSAPMIHNAADLSGFGKDWLAREVRFELVRLAYYGVFDNLEYGVNNGDVALMGEVLRPLLKSDAEYVVGRIKGVQHVDNRIEVLPRSADDDRLRLAVFAAIYGQEIDGLSVTQPVHIIVNGGRVKLAGVVGREPDKERIASRVSHLAGVISLTNELRLVP